MVARKQTDLLSNDQKLATILGILIIFVAFLSMGQLTGFASTQIGTTAVTIDSSVSIIMNDSVINFGNCTAGTAFLADSYESTDVTQCTNESLPGRITIDNDGNVDVNISINGTPASVFLGGTEPSFNWSVWNATSDGTLTGCDTADGVYITGLIGQDIASTNTNYSFYAINRTTVCENLSSGGSSMNVTVSMWVPADITQTGELTALVELYAEDASP